MARILCIATYASESELLDAELARGGHDAVHASSLAQGLRDIGQEPLDLVIASQSDSDAAATHLVDRLRQQGRDIPVILVGSDGLPAGGDSAPGSRGITILTRPLQLEALRPAVDRALQSSGLPLLPGPGTEALEIVGESKSLRRVIEFARVVAPTNASVLIEGESGTGKELLVRAIHRQSPRARAPLIAVNCAAMPEGLVESTLFGHERGAFTGATSRLIGAFERAHRSTLLLDEVSELRVDLQAKLLRAIQERQFERVGGSVSVRADVRIVATTNRDLLAEVEAGRFREDLYYRLRVIPLCMPPLRDRPEDVSALVRHFVLRTARELGIAPPAVPAATLAALERHAWPGNVRELEHATERAVILHAAGPLVPGDFLPEIAAGDKHARGMTAASAGSTGADAASGSLEGILDLDLLEQHAIARALEVTAGHRSRAALLLGISDRTLRNKLNGRRQSAGNGRSGFPRDTAVSSSAGTTPQADPSILTPSAAAATPAFLAPSPYPAPA